MYYVHQVLQNISFFLVLCHITNGLINLPLFSWSVATDFVLLYYCGNATQIWVEWNKGIEPFILFETHSDHALFIISFCQGLWDKCWWQRNSTEWRTEAENSDRKSPRQKPKNPFAWRSNLCSRHRKRKGAYLLFSGFGYWHCSSISLLLNKY